MKGKRMRTRGKVQLSRYFQNLENGQKVVVLREESFPAAFPRRMMGKTGTIVGSRGACKMLELMDGNSLKTFIIHPIHLKKLTQEANSK